MSIKKISSTLRITAECSTRSEVEQAAITLLNRMGSHVTTLAIGQKSLCANLLPLDPTYFDRQESYDFILRTLREALPNVQHLMLRRIRS